MLAAVGSLHMSESEAACTYPVTRTEPTTILLLLAHFLYQASDFGIEFAGEQHSTSGTASFCITATWWYRVTGPLPWWSLNAARYDRLQGHLSHVASAGVSLNTDSKKLSTLETQLAITQQHI